MGESMHGESGEGNWPRCSATSGCIGHVVEHTMNGERLLLCAVCRRRPVSKPKPAAGQVWRSPEGVEHVIQSAPSNSYLAIVGALLLRDYDCIGIETPAGRVMVGERRRCPAPDAKHCDPAEVLAVLDHGMIRVRIGNGEPLTADPKALAAWPLVSGPLAEAAKQAVRESAAWIWPPSMSWGWGGMPEYGNRAAEMVEAVRRQAAEAIERTLLGPCTCSPSIINRECARHGHVEKGSGSHAALAAFDEMRRAGYELRPEALERLGLSAPVPRVAEARSPFSPLANLKWIVAAHLGISTGAVDVEEEPAQGRVTVRVPPFVDPSAIRCAESLIQREMPSGILLGIFHKRPEAASEPATWAYVDGCAPISIPTRTPDHRAAREQRRREIDRVLAEDARQHPAFATARRCAVVAVCERNPGAWNADATLYGKRALATLLDDFHAYEDARGGRRLPDPKAREPYTQMAGWMLVAIDTYERARALP